MAASSQPPSHQSTLRVTLDPVDGLAGQASLPRNLSDAHGLLPQHRAHLVKLIARVARLTAEVSAFSAMLCVLDTGPLCGLGGLSLCLSGRGHEADQRITDSLLHRPRGPLAPSHPCHPWHPWAPDLPPPPMC